MSRKNIINLSLLLVLLVATFFIIKENTNSTSNLKKDAFSISDTNSIERIFIADMEGNSVRLSRQATEWLINDSFPANRVRIANMLEVLYKIEVKNPTPVTMINNVIKDMAAKSIKVEIYKNKRKPFKVIYIGGVTHDNLGTYMALEKNNKIPYVVHIPGFNGYLSDGYFFTDVDEWKSKEIFNYNSVKIKTVEVNYLSQPDSSFKLEVNNDFLFKMTRLSDNQELTNIREMKVKSFLEGFKDLYFVAINTDLKKEQKDSIILKGPIIKIIVTTENNKSKELFLYLKPSDIRTRAEISPGIDKEYLIGKLSNRPNELLLIQVLTLKRILWKIGDFQI